MIPWFIDILVGYLYTLMFTVQLVKFAPANREPVILRSTDIAVFVVTPPSPIDDWEHCWNVFTIPASPILTSMSGTGLSGQTPSAAGMSRFDLLATELEGSGST